MKRALNAIVYVFLFSILHKEIDCETRFGYEQIDNLAIEQSVFTYEAENGLESCFQKCSYIYNCYAFAMVDDDCYGYDKSNLAFVEEDDDSTLYIRDSKYIAEGYFAIDQKASAGNDIKILTDTSLSICVRECNKTISCKALAYNFEKNNCWLKDTVRKEEDFTIRPHSVFYTKDFRAFVSKKIYDIHPFHTMKGIIYSKIPNTPVFECANKHCFESADCLGFVYYKGGCYLFNEIVAIIPRQDRFAYTKLDTQLS
ncbi:DgyrCDS3215 [Dimorphilus gyrociliatus]|uniref:DgyrCDS3215 n=1 Tax=Dimorphilus gyrociliatus TaxID=2664684 RepID=A0A7I8VEF3_9ANNE|nr:DgyrCDS3215 [Dimorphilus gyrociliatus]